MRVTIISVPPLHTSRAPFSAQYYITPSLPRLPTSRARIHHYQQHGRLTSANDCYGRARGKRKSKCAACVRHLPAARPSAPPPVSTASLPRLPSYPNIPPALPGPACSIDTSRPGVLLVTTVPGTTAWVSEALARTPGHSCKSKMRRQTITPKGLSGRAEGVPRTEMGRTILLGNKKHLNQ